MPTAQALPPAKSQYDFVSPFKTAFGTSYSHVESKEKISYKSRSFQYEANNFIEEIPIHLTEVKQKIKDSRYILNYEYNWDDNGALPINPIIFDRAARFLESYTERIYDVCDKILISPEIVPVGDGSIDLEWTLENSSFLINFKNTKEEIAFYYGEFKDKDNVIFDTNGQVNTSTVKDKFASYLSDLS
jgi:hypothetical protein